MGRILKERLDGNHRGYNYQIDIVDYKDEKEKKLYLNGYIRLIDPEELPKQIVKLSKFGSGIKTYDLSYDEIKEDGRWVGFTMFEEDEDRCKDLNLARFIIEKIIEEISTYGMTPTAERKEVKLSIFDGNEGYGLMFIDEGYEEGISKDEDVYVTSDELIDITIKGYSEMTKIEDGVASIKRCGGLMTTINSLVEEPDNQYVIRKFMRIPSEFDDSKDRYNEAVDRFSEIFDKTIKEIEGTFHVKVVFDEEEDYDKFKETFMANMGIEM